MRSAQPRRSRRRRGRGVRGRGPALGAAVSERVPGLRDGIVDLISEGDKVAAHFRCSGTHRGEWLGVPPTGRRFEQVDEIYLFEVQDGKLVPAVGVEDNMTRMRQLGISPSALKAQDRRPE